VALDGYSARVPFGQTSYLEREIRMNALVNRFNFLNRFSTFILLAIGCAALQSSIAQVATTEHTWLDQSLGLDQRVDDLVQEMTLEEKVGQLRQLNGLGAPTGDGKHQAAREELLELIRKGQVGSILNEISISTINEYQGLAIKESRLGIPLIIGRDVIHGYRTIFPIPLGQAASWNPQLVKEGCAIAAREARSQGIHWTFAPMVDIARDPRWGRIAESFGEDPVLCSALSAASVKGYQGDDLSSQAHIAACVKHFVGYGAAEGGRDYNATVISPSAMRNIYLPPFKAAVDAGVATLMCAFNDVNGIPMSAHTYLLRDVLRKEWGFQGFVVSDWESIREMIPHGFAADERDAAVAAIRAGVNMEMASTTFHNFLVKAVEDGDIQEEIIDDLVKEILRIKFQLRLFENPFVKEGQTSVLLTGDHLEAARKLARQSVVMLKNEKGTLPIKIEKIKKIAVIGPLANAKREQLGTWIPDGREEDSITPLAGIREAAGDNAEVTYVAALKNDLDRSTEGFTAAVAAAENADLVVLIVGEQARLSGEASSRAIIDLPGAQNELIKTVAEVGKPTVMIVEAGRPLTIGPQVAQVDAVLYSFHAGTMAGPAIADLLWGKQSPSGKLPVTLLKSVGQIPLYYNHTNTGRPPRKYELDEDKEFDDEFDLELGYNSNYLDVRPYPLFPFGYGLSYTEFDYGKVELSTNKLKSGQVLAVRVPVTNKGKAAGDEVVQVYIRDLVGSITRPVRELKAFRRIAILPGQTEVLEFAISTDDLKFYNNEEQLLLEPGKFELYVGGSSAAPLAATFEVVK
jgi:beta-glucosidase